MNTGDTMKKITFRTRVSGTRIVFDFNKQEVHIFESIFKSIPDHNCSFKRLKIKISHSRPRPYGGDFDSLESFIPSWQVNLIVPDLSPFQNRYYPGKKSLLKRLKDWFKFEPEVLDRGDYCLVTRVFKKNAINFAKNLALQIGLNFITIDSCSTFQKLKKLRSGEDIIEERINIV